MSSYWKKGQIISRGKKEKDEYELKNKGDFKLIYLNIESYEEYLQHAQKLYEDWIGASIIRYKKELQKRDSIF